MFEIIEINQPRFREGRPCNELVTSTVSNKEEWLVVAPAVLAEKSEMCA